MPPVDAVSCDYSGIHLMRIIAFPASGIAYNEGFYQAVRQFGTCVEDGVFSGRWLWRELKRGDVVHVHWPSFLYGGATTKPAALFQFLRFVALLLLMRFKGAGLVWTAHNLLPHDPSPIPAIDVLARKLVIALSDIILIHGPSAAEVLSKRFPGVTSKLLVIPHGNWIGFYPISEDREACRKRLGLTPRDFTYVFFGLCKPYKNLHGLVEAFKSIEGAVSLVIVGRFQDEAYHEEIVQLIGDDERISLVPSFINDEDVHRYLLAADAVVAPYREILTSGTAMLAMSFGRPLVSVRKGFLIDVVSEQNGVLYNPDDPRGLSAAMDQVRRLSWDEDVIGERARGFRFEDAARKMLDALGSG
jgi:glycosyltransferase involved in cell wall biosynthesis